MKKITLGLAVAASLAATSAFAHLCDDVFRQAKDNLAVKVDVRDGQLRVGREAEFKVYLLNTMDRDIVEIMLRVKSDQFTADIKPGPEWKDYPALRTAARNGKRQYFTVTLRRNEGVADGTYKIDLDLYSEKQGKSFLNVAMDAAADIVALPAAGSIVIDGDASRAEWGSAALCSDFTIYRKTGKYFEDAPPRWPARVRMLQDRDNVYLLFNLQATPGISEDVLSIHAAPDADTAPVKISFDRLSGAVTGPPGAADKIRLAMNQDKTVLEARVPKSVLGLERAAAFLVNFTRAAAEGEYREISYWRGNNHSINDPVIYARFVPNRN